jgi:hypothetical protein
MPFSPAWGTAAALRGTAAIQHRAPFAREAELAFDEVRRHADASDRSQHQPHLSLAPCDTANDTAATFAHAPQTAIVRRYLDREGRSRANVQCGGREKKAACPITQPGRDSKRATVARLPSFHRARWRGRRRRHRPEIVRARSLCARRSAAPLSVLSDTRSTHATTTRPAPRSSGWERRSAPVAAAMSQTENPLA